MSAAELLPHIARTFPASSTTSAEESPRRAFFTTGMPLAPIDSDVTPRPIHKVTDGLMMRVDFGNSYVELDRGVSYSDRRAKTFAGRSHMGEMTQRGYWGDEIKRSGQSSAAAIMVYENDVAERLDALAVHRGPCYVRLSTGVAYEADVQVSGPNISVGSAGMQYSLAITKIALTQEYMAVPVDSAEDGE